MRSDGIIGVKRPNRIHRNGVAIRAALTGPNAAVLYEIANFHRKWRGDYGQKYRKGPL